MNWIKEIGVLILRLVLVFIIYYVIGMFVGAYIKQFFPYESVWKLTLSISVYILFTAFIFYNLGVYLSKLSKLDDVYFDIAFPFIILMWGIVTTITTDIAYAMKTFLWELTYGWASPLYSVVNKIVKNDINQYKYIFISFWTIISTALFLGLYKKYLPDIKRKKFKHILLATLGIMFILMNTPSAIKSLTPHIFNIQTYPKIDGATASIPLGQILAQNLLGKDVIEAEKFVEFNTTHDAYVNLINKNADIIFAAEPSDEELLLANQNGIKLKLKPIGTDAFVFIANKENPVDGLTINDIREIYSGKLTNWKQLGGNDEDIIAYQRPQNSGSQTIMENVVMKNLALMEAPSEETPGGMEMMLEVIDYKNSTNAIGYSIYYYANVMNKKENIKFLTINGIPCNTETIRSNEYLFSGSLYAVTRENDESENTIKLLEFLLTSNGQEYVEMGGFVPLSK